ncbi:MAG: hypothetical protein FJ288_07650 [Planctomycetes bacterium]|nr:hypothetical protein [Planctomycetota bacterium]
MIVQGLRYAPLAGLLAGAWLIMSGPAAAGEAPAPAAVFETEHLRLAVGPDGCGTAFIDRRTGKDYWPKDRAHPFIFIRRGGRVVAPTGLAADGGAITAAFPDGISVTVRITQKPRWLVLEVESVRGAGHEQVVFGALRLDLTKRVSPISGVASDGDFAACVRALNLKANLRLGGVPAHFEPTAYARYAFAGAKAALVGCPASALRPLLQDLVREEGLPWSPVGGPFALDAEENRGSYVFATVSEKNADEWIALAKRAGLAQIHLIGWEQSLGHYEPRADLFPGGLDGLKAVVAKIHAAGLRAGMHVLSGGISRDDPFVRPVPDRRLAKDGRFTLAADVGEADKNLPLAEPPGDLATHWAYSGRSNVVQVGDELIQYTAVSQAEPYALGGCTRGAFGTRAAAHQKGADVHHLFAIYDTFQPDPDSTLVDDVAERIARPFNECKFDMIYMDGAEGMPDGWHGCARMREAIFRRLKGRVLVEASEWGHHSWPFHSRLGAYDYPHWGLKRFVDVHCRDAEGYQAASLLPAQLGWWAILGPSKDHPSEFPDEIEYLCVKSLATDMPMSFQGIGAGAKPWNARQDEYLDVIGRYERLRLGRAVPEEVRARLRTPREEFRLMPAGGGAWQFVPADYAVHKVTGADDGSMQWTVRNRFGPQALRGRIEALYAAAPYDSPEAVVLAAMDRPDELAASGAMGVAASWSPVRDVVRGAAASARYEAANALPSRAGAWAALRKTFDPPLDLAKCGALGAWIHGDGGGELLNFQLTNPPRFWPAWAENYVDVNFKGWRYVELHLRERPADRFGDYSWPYGGTSAVFRSPLIRDHTSALAIYCNNLPPDGRAVCHIGPVKALPTVKIRIGNPALSAGGRRLVFPATLESGQYLEFDGAAEARLYDERGGLLAKVQPQGDAPQLAAGDNPAAFSCESPPGHRTRVRVTLVAQGEPFGPLLRP